MKRLIDFRHPFYTRDFTDWEKFRLCYIGGDAFVRRYLEKFDRREDQTDFARRQRITPIPSFAKAAINDIRNAVFQRMADIIRRGGTDSYQKAVVGLEGGVDNLGSTMNSFLGTRILTDLLTMGRIGVYVDAPSNSGPTRATQSRPYIYPYQIEDICSWSHTTIGGKSEYKSVLLRDTVFKYDALTGLPDIEFVRYRYVFLGDDGFVRVQFYDNENLPIDPDGNPAVDDAIKLELRRIPFVMFDIGGSLLEDVASYQIAMLQLISADVNYATLANFPIYVEQADTRAGGVGSHLKPVANEDGTATAGGQGSNTREIQVGVAHGRQYAQGTNQPDFIHPSSEPVLTSMRLREQFEQEIRKLVNLAVVNIANRASAESKVMDNQGLEAGLSYIGLVLEKGERQIADYWGAYEKSTSVALISYPSRYSLKSDRERIEEASALASLMFKVPGRSVKKEIAKAIVTVLLSAKVSHEELEDIFKEIDESDYCTSDPETIIKAKEAGLVGEKIASIALGFSDEEYLQAREDHLARIIRIAEAQVEFGNERPAARGVDDLDPNTQSGRDEKAESRETDLKDTTKEPVRGEGK